MVSAGQLAAFAAAAFVLTVIPGPSVLFAVGRALAYGRATALATVAGNAVGLESWPYAWRWAPARWSTVGAGVHRGEAGRRRLPHLAGHPRRAATPRPCPGARSASGCPPAPEPRCCARPAISAAPGPAVCGPRSRSGPPPALHGCGQRGTQPQPGPRPVQAAVDGAERTTADDPHPVARLRVP